MPRHQKSSDMPAEPVDRRDPEQDAAMEQAFVAGTLPEEDRRQSAMPEPMPERSEQDRRGDANTVYGPTKFL